jgi:hypothetical protein
MKHVARAEYDVTPSILGKVLFTAMQRFVAIFLGNVLRFFM